MPDRPHFVFIILEDSGRLLGCDGDAVSRKFDLTPNLDALAARGCRWENLFATSPVCAPSRSSMVTGQHPIKIGTHQMRSKLLRPPKLMTQYLMDAGYHVSWPTKTDFNFDPDDAPGGRWCDDTEDWSDRLRAGEAPGDKPTFFYVNFSGTHESGMWAPGHPPGWNGRAGWDGDDAALFPPPDAVTVPPYLPDTPEVRTDIARHYRNLRHVDGQVGEVLDRLRQSGRRENTFVVVISDHGRGLPREKRWCYPAGLRVPMVIAGPGIDPGSVRRDVVSMVDLPATVLQLAGIERPDDFDGVSALGDTPRDLAFFGRDRMDEAYDCVRGVTDGRWFYLRNDFPDIARAQRNRYMEWMASVQVMRRMFAEGTLEPPADRWFQPRPAEELYDLDADPHGLSDLSAEVGHRATLQRLRGEVEAWRDRCDDRGRVPERDLIDRGEVGDTLSQYLGWVEPLPAGLKPPGRCGVTERPG